MRDYINCVKSSKSLINLRSSSVQTYITKYFYFFYFKSLDCNRTKTEFLDFNGIFWNDTTNNWQNKRMLRLRFYWEKKRRKKWVFRMCGFVPVRQWEEGWLLFGCCRFFFCNSKKKFYSLRGDWKFTLELKMGYKRGALPLCALSPLILQFIYDRKLDLRQQPPFFSISCASGHLLYFVTSPQGGNLEKLDIRPRLIFFCT